MSILLFAVASVIAADPPAPVDPPAAGKPPFFTLINARPRGEMRDMSTDRPDTTESPFTVDAGHVQVEMSLVDVGHDKRDGTGTTAIAVAPLLFKVGLLHDVDVQLGVEPYARVKEDGGGTTEGFGDLATRLKINLWGNDGAGEAGDTAFAFMPFVKFPTGGDGLSAERIEGGLIFPFGVQLAERWGLGAMLELDAVYDAARQGYAIDLVHTVTVGFDVTERIGLYAEYAGFHSLNQHELYRGYFDAGGTYALTADVQLDGGVRVGLTSAAEDFGVFVGVSWRY